jgi:hypothetical protein
LRLKSDAMENKKEVRFFEFDCEAVNLPAGTKAPPRPASRPRVAIPASSHLTTEFQSFDCETVDLPHSTKAQPRPKGCERPNLNGTQPAKDVEAIIEQNAKGQASNGSMRGPQQS